MIQAQNIRESPSLKLSKVTGTYGGKVRDMYYMGDKLVVANATDRVSAYDHSFKKTIPHKGQIINQISSLMFEETKDICPNWVLDTPVSHISVGYRCKPFKIEMVVRGNLTGSAWRLYKNGVREICGNILPDGMIENQFFSTPIVTPTTKATEGHDENINPQEIFDRGLATKEEWKILKKYSLDLFKRGKEFADYRGLILVDTKYEFGRDFKGTIRLIDEVHTPDSSRYFYKKDFQPGVPPKQLSKEIFRDWLKEQGFTGDPGQKVPRLTKKVREMLSKRYIEIFEVLFDKPFGVHYYTKDEIINAVDRSVTFLQKNLQ